MTTIPNYTILSIVYAGRNTTLYKGRHLAHGHEVAIKVATHGTPAAHSQSQAALRHEYEVLRRLDVPGVVRVLELVSSAHGPALVMDMLPGLPLDQFLAQYPTYNPGRARPALREGPTGTRIGVRNSR